MCSLLKDLTEVYTATFAKDKQIVRGVFNKVFLLLFLFFCRGGGEVVLFFHFSRYCNCEKIILYLSLGIFPGDFYLSI